MKSNKELFVLGLFLLLSLQIYFFSIQNKPNKINIEVPKSSYEGVSRDYDYLDYYYKSFTLTSQYGIDWSFSSENPNVGILVMTMDKTNFLKYILNESDVSFHVLSDGRKTKDKGYSVPDSS